MAPLILERVNAYFGWRCADKLMIRQGRVTKAPGQRQFARPSAEALAKGRKSAAGIEDEGLRNALAGLGAEVFARRSGKRKGPS
jgi:hypothetical protein